MTDWRHHKLVPRRKNVCLQKLAAPATVVVPNDELGIPANMKSTGFKICHYNPFPNHSQHFSLTSFLLLALDATGNGVRVSQLYNARGKKLAEQTVVAVNAGSSFAGAAESTASLVAGGGGSNVAASASAAKKKSLVGSTRSAAARAAKKEVVITRRRDRGISPAPAPSAASSNRPPPPPKDVPGVRRQGRPRAMSPPAPSQRDQRQDQQQQQSHIPKPSFVRPVALADDEIATPNVQQRPPQPTAPTRPGRSPQTSKKLLRRLFPL